ncbi:MAG: hypothetical protein ACJ8C4_14590 [Gemmataceae bacterium]
MSVFWFTVICDSVPDNFEEGIVLAEGLDPEGELDREQLQYAILARVCCSDAAEAQRIIADATTDFLPISFTLIADNPKDIVRAERRLTRVLTDGDASIHDRFIGFSRGPNAPTGQAHEIIEMSVRRRRWQFWR